MAILLLCESRLRLWYGYADCGRPDAGKGVGDIYNGSELVIAASAGIRLKANATTISPSANFHTSSSFAAGDS